MIIGCREEEAYLSSRDLEVSRNTAATWEWCSPTTHSRNTFCLNKGIMVQFCNVNSCQFLKYIFYKDHFLASNELGNWPQILTKFLTISQKQNTSKKNAKQNKTKPHQPIGVKIAQLNLKANYTIYRQVYTEIVFESMEHSCS